MSERVKGRLFVDPAFPHSGAEGFLKAAFLDGFRVIMWRRKEPERVAMKAPIGSVRNVV